MSCIGSLHYNTGLKCKYAKILPNTVSLCKTTCWNAILNKKHRCWVFLRHCLAWFRTLGYFYWPAAEPLADARGTLGFRGTPVENHCTRDSKLSYSEKPEVSISPGLQMVPVVTERQTDRIIVAIMRYSYASSCSILVRKSFIECLYIFFFFICFKLHFIVLECHARFSTEGSMMILTCFDSVFSVLVYV